MAVWWRPRGDFAQFFSLLFAKFLEEQNGYIAG